MNTAGDFGRPPISLRGLPMLVRQLAGPFANQDIEMSFDAVVSAYQQGTVKLMPDQESIVRNHLTRQEIEVVDAVEAVVAPAPVATVVKRRGGWPKGKPRGPRRPQVMA